MFPRFRSRTTPLTSGSLPVLGHALEFLRDPATIYEECRQSSEDLVRIDLGPQTLYYVTDPWTIEEVLVERTDCFRKGEFVRDTMGPVWGDSVILREDDRWRDQRSRLQQFFEVTAVDRYAETVNHLTEARLQDWSAGDCRRVDREFQVLALELLVEQLFDADLDRPPERVVDAADDVAGKFQLSSMSVLLPEWVPTGTNRAFRSGRERLDAVVASAVEDGRDGSGLVAGLLAAAERPKTDLSEAAVRDELRTFMLEHRTLGLAIAYTLHLLAANPDRQRRVRDALADQPAADLPSVQPLRGAVKEALRLYPSVHTVYRQPRWATELAGRSLDPDDVVALSPYVVHRDGRFYDDPETFRPGRWSDGFEEQLPGQAYFPFGAGPRHCIGMRVAELSARVVVASVLGKFELRNVEPEDLPLSFSLGLEPDGGIRVDLA